MKVVASGITDVGCVRKSNEDSLGLFPEHHLYIVADGMGGHAAGEVASRMAVDALKAFMDAPPDFQVPQGAEAHLVAAIEQANRTVYKAGMENPALAGMGTTLVALLAKPEAVIVAHVGDSRLYRLRRKDIQQLTQDHSLVNDYVLKGLLTQEAAEHHPQRHVLSRAIGTALEVEVEVLRSSVRPGDTYLLCSDGLSNKLKPSEIAQCIRAAKGDLKTAGEALIAEAKGNGGEDNITALLVAYPV